MGKGAQRAQRAHQAQLNQLAEAVAAKLGSKQQQSPQQRSGQRQEWFCGVCLTSNWLSRSKCRNCNELHNLPALPRVAPKATGGGKGKGNGKTNSQQQSTRASLNATVQAARAAGASEQTVQRLKQDAAQAKQEKQTLGARLDSATATLKKAREQFRRSEDALAQAQKRREEAAAAVEDAEEELARLKEKAAGGVVCPVFAEAEALLEELETAPLVSSVSNRKDTESRVVPEALLTRMRSLRDALAAEGVQREAVYFHVDTPHDSDAENEGAPGRGAERTTAARRRARSDTPTRSRARSVTRTPPPTTRC